MASPSRSQCSFTSYSFSLFILRLSGQAPRQLMPIMLHYHLPTALESFRRFLGVTSPNFITGANAEFSPTESFINVSLTSLQNH